MELIYFYLENSNIGFIYVYSFAKKSVDLGEKGKTKAVERFHADLNQKKFKITLITDCCSNIP